MFRSARYLLLATAAISLTATLVACGGGSSSSSVYEGLELAKTVAVPNATLTNTSNQEVNLPTLAKGKLTLVYFGYTNCPDICPTTMADLNTALGQLTDAQRAETQVVFITTDPKDDTLPVLRKWLDGFNTSFIGLRSSLVDIQATAAKLGVVAEDPTTDDQGHVTDTHGAQVMAFSPSDSLARLVWTAGTTPSQYAHDIRLLLA